MPLAPSLTNSAKLMRFGDPLFYFMLRAPHRKSISQGEKCENLVVPSSGVHIVLPDYYSPRDMGLLDPATSDGRVIYFLPWVPPLFLTVLKLKSSLLSLFSSCAALLSLSSSPHPHQEGKTLSGTTDTPSVITDQPKPLEEEISFILKEVGNYLNKV